MYDSEKEYKNQKKTLAKFFYRFFDFILPESDVPIFGKISNKFRCFFAKRISKGIHKKAFIQKGAIIVPGVFVEERGCVGVKCYTSWGCSYRTRHYAWPKCIIFH